MSEPENEHDLSGLCLHGAKLRHAKLGGVRFERAGLGGAQLSGAVLSKAVLMDADLSGAKLLGADLSGADLRRANLQGATLTAARMEGAKLFAADLRNANLGVEFPDSRLITHEQADKVRLRGADLYGADLRGANLTGAVDFALDGNDLTDVRFAPRSSDPWSTLRRRYTGVMTAFHLLFATTAMAPYIARTLWAYVPVVELGYWRIAVLTGYHIGFLTFFSSLTLIAYNLLRLVFTWWLSLLREEELRTNRAPAKSDYWKFWLVHSRFMRWVEYAAIGLGSWRTLQWLCEPI